jgi:S-adenosylmethionine/arginine decarboxylase-like enzyme
MKLNLTNTSQTLIVNSYYGYACNESNRLNKNKEIDLRCNADNLMSIIRDMSEILNTTILHTSQHSFEPSGKSLSSIIESDDINFGSSGVAHLNESHISFHSYFENSIKNIIILRLELHISSCSRKSVYFTLDNLMGEKLFNSYDGLTLDFFHRGIDLEQNHENHSIITLFLENKSKEFNVTAHDQTESFSHYKIVKHKEKIGLRELYDYFYNYLI